MRLVRNETTDDGIFGQLQSDDGKTVYGVTLERNYDGEPIIKPGIYKCVRRMSPRFGCDVFMLVDVPFHHYIEIHVANWQYQLRGCVALGKAAAPSPQGRMITESDKTFAAFMAAMDGIDAFMLQVSEVPSSTMV